MEYGERLKTARRLRNMTQHELAEKSGVKQTTISKIERGDQKGSKSDMDLCFALQINPVWLSRGMGNMEPMEAESAPMPSLHLMREEEWKSFSPTARIFIENLVLKIKEGEIGDDGLRVLQSMIDMMKKARLNNLL